MKYLSLLFALFLAACASQPHGIHTYEFVGIILSPKHRTDETWHLTLLSVSHSGRVRVRGHHGSNGDIYSARVGERFHIGNGASLDCTLKSVNAKTGQVVISGQMRIYH